MKTVYGTARQMILLTFDYSVGNVLFGTPFDIADLFSHSSPNALSVKHETVDRPLRFKHLLHLIEQRRNFSLPLRRHIRQRVKVDHFGAGIIIFKNV